jgi:thiol:disulfide interchange protein DsbA
MSNNATKHFYLFSAVTVTLFVGYILAAINTTPVIAADNPAPAPSMMASFTEGKHYVTKFPKSTRAKEPVITEFFSYTCPHCYSWEPRVKKWKKQKPEGIKFEQIPVTFSGNRVLTMIARGHYAAEELGVLEQYKAAMFKRIHIDKKLPRNERDIAVMFEALGVSEADFKKASVNNFNVESKIRRSDFLASQYQVSSVPYFLINYKYEMGNEGYSSEETIFSIWNNLPFKDFK